MFQADVRKAKRMFSVRYSFSVIIKAFEVDVNGGGKWANAREL